MIAARYPGIHDEPTTVEFLIDGLKHNAATVDFGRTIMGMNPKTIKDFANMYNRITAYNTSTISLVPAPHPFSTPQSSRQVPSRITPRITPIPNPCSFHLQFTKRFPPTHTDAQCMDPRHPKFAQTSQSQQLWHTRKPAFQPRPSVKHIKHQSNIAYSGPVVDTHTPYYQPYTFTQSVQTPNTDYANQHQPFFPISRVAPTCSIRSHRTRTS